MFLMDDFFKNSIKEINSLRKEINRLLSNVKYLLKSYYRREKLTFSIKTSIF